MAYNLQKWTDRSALLSEAERRALPAALARRVLRLRAHSADEATAILSVSVPDLADPFTLKDMQLAVDEILALIPKKGRIVVHGDYDTDGVTSSAILMRTFRTLGLEVFSFIPNRLTDGYGLAAGGVDFAIEMKADLLVTCDCGVQSFAEVESLNAAGIPVVVTDHHHCLSELPAARAVVNPNRLDDLSSMKGLAGAGVALKLVQALGIALDKPELWEAVVDLAAVGTVGDAMDLVGENRSIVRHGLVKLNDNPNPGLAALMKAVKIDELHCTAVDIGYKISPKLNAAGRLGDSEKALALLLADDAKEAERHADNLLDQNDRRKEIESESVAAALAALQENPSWLKHQAVVITLEDGHAGVMGIIAGRLAELLACSVIVLMLDKESEEGQAFWRGSARSYGSCSVLDLITAASAYTRSFGGHHAAAGVEVAVEEIDDFRLAIQQAADALPAEELSGSERYYECALQADELTIEQAYDLERLEPFGEGHPTPYFMLKGVALAERRVIGQTKQHLRLMLSLDGLDNYVPAVYFGGASRLSEDVRHADIIVQFKVNRFRGQESLQLLVFDFAPAATDMPGEGEQMREIESLYRRFDRWGGPELAAILGTDVEKLEPDKSVLANLYRLLAGLLANSPQRIALPDLTEMLKSVYNINSNDFHVRRVLEIYQEAGLIVIRRINDYELLLGLVKANGKTDLYETATWKRLTLSM